MKRIFSCWMLLLVIFISPLACAADITIYVAKKIITMDPVQPEATAVAVKSDGRIFSVGSLAEMQSWMKAGSYTVDNTFANDIITPGMIEAHCHWTMLSVFMQNPYVGYWDFPGFNGGILPAAKTKQAVMDVLKAADKKMSDPKKVLFAWGYDPIFFDNSDLTAADLDSISTTRPIFVLNASEHIGYANSVLMKKANYTAQTKIPGVEKGTNGQPNGVLKEADAMGPVLASFYAELFTADSFKKALYDTAETAHRLGLTTVSDLLFGGPGEDIMLTQMKNAANDKQYPERMVMVYNGLILAMLEQKQKGAGIAHMQSLIKQNSAKLKFGSIKLVSDGSIQGFTSRLNWPGYFNGRPNGLWNTTLAQMKVVALPFWQAGFPIHVHVNGDEATDAGLDLLDYLQTIAPRRDQVFVLEHNQMSSPEQFRRARRLGAYTNIFANHLYYWGDQHYSILLGPDRANRMDNSAEAIRQGIIFSLHSDSPVTPLGPLHSMWAAMNRTTVSGRVLGAENKISAEQALRAVTLNAAYLLSLQNEIGSIAIGKRADFTVLAQDPLTVEANAVKDIPVVATVTDGVVFGIK